MSTLIRRGIEITPTEKRALDRKRQAASLAAVNQPHEMLAFQDRRSTREMRDIGQSLGLINTRHGGAL